MDDIIRKGRAYWLNDEQVDLILEMSADRLELRLSSDEKDAVVRLQQKLAKKRHPAIQPAVGAVT